ncbi:opine dehydrogenase [Phyllobacterium sp. YR620]|uniref:NAD/NADP octopine/nopaline dehydrogenase family protein n=1 Tax=Phyllobacterium sp. YR620 TaxID=1881066 RepID=UPI0008808B23|nr:NAD/NADP octopine/nopaline dehydrogenase family protein [Phyllobacterium sp. YR620]SDO88635.1 opine dehydrogenase [Phyllobacterium sp. YR620]
MTDILIVGGGHVGRTLLVDLISSQEIHGKDPRLLFFRSNEVDVKNRIAEASGTVKFEKVLSASTMHVEVDPSLFSSFDDPRAAEAISTASVIFITVPDIPALRLEIFRKLGADFDLRDKTIVLVKAGQATQPVVAEMIRRGHPLADADVIFAESFYGTRAEQESIVGNRKLSINISILSRDPARALDKLRGCFPLGDRIGKPSWPDFTVLSGVDLVFSATAYFLHVAIVLHPRNFALTQAGVQYNHYLDGIDRSLAQKLDAIDRERVALGRVYGVELERFPEVLNRQYGLPILPNFYDMMQSCREVYKSMASPKSVELLQRSRHILEDVPALYTIEWLMQRAGIAMPATAAYVAEVNKALSSLDIDQTALTVHRPLLAEIQGGPQAIVNLLNAPHRTAAAT